MPAFYYTHPLDNLLLEAASITVTTGTEEEGYEVEKLSDGHWAWPFKIAEDTLVLDIVFAAPVQLLFAILGNSNVTVAADLWGHSDGTFGGGTPDIDLAFGIPTARPNGFFSSPFLRPVGLASRTHYRLKVTSNADPVAIGEFFLGGVARGLTNNYLYRGLRPEHVGASVVHRTHGRVGLGYEQASSIRTIDGILLVGESERALLEALVAATRHRARPFWVVPRSDVDDAWFVRLMTDAIPELPLGPALFEVPFPLEMESRGLPFVDPDA